MIHHWIFRLVTAKMSLYKLLEHRDCGRKDQTQWMVQHYKLPQGTTELHPGSCGPCCFVLGFPKQLGRKGDECHFLFCNSSFEAMSVSTAVQSFYRLLHTKFHPSPCGSKVLPNLLFKHRLKGGSPELLHRLLRCTVLTVVSWHSSKIVPD